MFKGNDVIGNTPMIRIEYRYKREKRHVFAKLEYFNLTGSIKDRVAYYIIKNAKEREELKEGMPIVEATSGNTGISLAALGAYYKHPVYIFMPDWASVERVKLMSSYGAKVILVSREAGGFKKCVDEAKKMAKEINGFCLQPTFMLAPNLKYKADFIVFHKDGSSEVIDVKGFKTKEYIAKKKVFEDKFNLKITEI